MRAPGLCLSTALRHGPARLQAESWGHLRVFYHGGLPVTLCQASCCWRSARGWRPSGWSGGAADRWGPACRQNHGGCLPWAAWTASLDRGLASACSGPEEPGSLQQRGPRPRAPRNLGRAEVQEQLVGDASCHAAVGARDVARTGADLPRLLGGWGGQKAAPIRIKSKLETMWTPEVNTCLGSSALAGAENWCDPWGRAGNTGRAGLWQEH